MEGDEPKATRVTRYNSFEFLVMFFGLTNAPTIFCNMMNDVLYEFFVDFCGGIFDNIVVYSNSLVKHVAYLRQVFFRFKEHCLYVKKEKCEFCRSNMMFLSY